MLRTGKIPHLYGTTIMMRKNAIMNIDVYKKQVYYRTRKFAEYGKLSKKNIDDLEAGHRDEAHSLKAVSYTHLLNFC